MNATKTSIIVSAMQKGKDVNQTIAMLEKAGFRKVSKPLIYVTRSKVKNGTFGNATVKATLSKTSPDAAKMLHGFKVASILPNIPTSGLRNRHAINAIAANYIKAVNKADRMKVKALKTAIKGLTKVMNA